MNSVISPVTNSVKKICLLGLGEVGTTLANDFANIDVKINAYDVLFSDKKSGPSQSAKNYTHVQVCKSIDQSMRDCQLVISAVTAEQCTAAAASVASVLEKDAWFLDLNSVSPGTRKQAAANISAVGGRYVECSVMSPIQPLGSASPMLLGGPHATEFEAVAIQLGLDNSRVLSEELGQASAAKMCRSVIIKGMEALVSESLLSARHYGVESVVIDSLQNLMPGVDWEEHARYMISRTLNHGIRRAEEMRQVVATLEDAGIEPLMSTACVSRQQNAPNYAAAADEPELNAMLDRILSMCDNEGDHKGKTNAHY